MSDDFKPGDLLTDDDGSLFFVVDHVPVDRDHPLYSAPCVVDADGNGWRRGSLDPSARRLVVIDPEDREQVERLHALWCEAIVSKGTSSRQIDSMQAEFATTDPLWTEEVDALAAEREDQWDADVNEWWAEMAEGDR